MVQPKEIYDPIQNKYYSSIDELCKDYNISKYTFYKTYKKCEGNIDNTFNKLIKEKEKRDNLKVIYEGVEYKSLFSLCKKLNLPLDTINYRIRHGYSLEEALHTPIKRIEYVELGGKRYKSLHELCRELNINYYTIISRLSRGYTIEQAINEDAHRGHKVKHALKAKQITINGAKYSSLGEACKDYGISKQTVYNRLKRGMNIEDAITLEKKNPWKKSKLNINTLSIMGKTYDSLAKLSNEYKASQDRVRSRILSGLDVEVAVISETSTSLRFIGLDNKSYYHVAWSNDYVTARDIVKYYRPDLVSLYDRYNPTGEYNPYRG